MISFVSLLLCFVSSVWADETYGRDGRYGRSSNEYSQYSTARQQWEMFGFSSYSMEFSWDLSCCRCKVAKKKLVVVNDTVGQVTCLSSSCTTYNCSNSSDLDVDNYDSIDGLFNLIENAFDNNYSQISVSYDSILGFPKSAKLGATKKSNDTIGWSISCINIPSVYNTCNDSFLINSTSAAYIKYVVAKTLWTSKSIKNYRMKFKWSCFCTSCYVAQKAIVVTNDTISNVTCTNTTFCSGCTDGLQVSYYKTITGLFEMIASAFQQGYAQISVVYNSRLGYPTSGYLDKSLMIADEEISWSIDCLTVLNKGINWKTCKFFPFGTS